jgi:hypothetical protein
VLLACFVVAWAAVAAWGGFVTVALGTKECGWRFGYGVAVEAVALGVLGLGCWAALAARRWWMVLPVGAALLAPAALGYVIWIACNAWSPG